MTSRWRNDTPENVLRDTRWTGCFQVSLQGLSLYYRVSLPKKSSRYLLLKSYLSNRTSPVKFRVSKLSYNDIYSGVLQENVLGPVIFLLYTLIHSGSWPTVGYAHLFYSYTMRPCSFPLFPSISSEHSIFRRNSQVSSLRLYLSSHLASTQLPRR